MTIFNKSSSWLYNKFNGRDGNGGIGSFSEAEKTDLKKHLLEFAETIRTAVPALSANESCASRNDSVPAEQVQ